MIRILKAAGAYFAFVMGAGIALGCIGVPFIVPRIGVRAAELIEMPVMLIVIVLSAKRVVRRFGLLTDVRACVAVGSIALLSSVAAQLLLAAALHRMSPVQFIASRDPIAGFVHIVVLALFGLMPAILARIDALRSLILEH